MRAIASLSLSFGLVSIPVKLYAATESSKAIRFKLMHRGGAKLRQQLVAAALPQMPLNEPPEEPMRVTSRSAAKAPMLALERPLQDDESEELPAAFDGPRPHAELREDDVVDREEVAKGYEYEKGRFVLFSEAELKAMRIEGSDSIGIVAFVPRQAVDPIYYDKAYLLAPDRRGEKTYALLLRALQESDRSAIGRWAWKGREHVVQIRASDKALVLHQLFYADEVRSADLLPIAPIDVGEAELRLALQLIAQGSQATYDPSQYVDEYKQRLLAAIDRKVAGRAIISHAPVVQSQPSAKVVDLLDALRASLERPATAKLPARKPVARASARSEHPGMVPAAAKTRKQRSGA